MASTSKTMNLFNNKLVKSFDEMTEEQLESKIKLADKAFKSCRKLVKFERA